MTVNWGMIGADLESCRAAWAIKESGQGRIASVSAEPSGWGRELLALTAARPAGQPQALLDDPSLSAVIISGTMPEAESLAAASLKAHKNVILTLPLGVPFEAAAQLEAQAVATGCCITALSPSAGTPEFELLAATLASGTTGPIGTVRLGRLEQALNDNAPHDAPACATAILADLIVAAESCAGPLLRLRVLPAPAGTGRHYLLAAGRFESGALVHLEAGLTESAGAHYFYFEVACAKNLVEFDSRIEREYVLSDSDSYSPLRSACSRLVDSYARVLAHAAAGMVPAGLLRSAARASALVATCL